MKISLRLPTNATYLGGNCDIDVDECKSFPCKNGATCTDSTTESAVSYHAYQCTCVAGFANGVCEYDFIAEVETECNVMHADGIGGCFDIPGWFDLNGNSCDDYAFTSSCNA